MKRFLMLPVFAALFLSVMFGCKKNKEENPIPSNPSTASFEEQVKKKWTVSTGAARLQRTTASSADYISFEFTDKGTYYIIKADKSFLKGDFALAVGDSSIALNGLGVIYIDEITDTDVTFRFVLNTSSEVITIQATPVIAVSTTPKTQSLVNKWSFKTRSVNGTPDSLINATFSTGGYHLYIEMSEFGTYAIDTNLPSGSGAANTVGVWKWCDIGETTFSTSNEASVQPTCGTNSTVGVSFKANGDLQLTLLMNGNTQVDTYVLLP
jgi:hypothetical protein